MGLAKTLGHHTVAMTDLATTWIPSRRLLEVGRARHMPCRSGADEEWGCEKHFCPRGCAASALVGVRRSVVRGPWAGPGAIARRPSTHSGRAEPGAGRCIPSGVVGLLAQRGRLLAVWSRVASCKGRDAGGVPSRESGNERLRRDTRNGYGRRYSVSTSGEGSTPVGDRHQREYCDKRNISGRSRVPVDSGSGLRSDRRKVVCFIRAALRRGACSH